MTSPSEDRDILWSVRATGVDTDGKRRALVCEALVSAIHEKEQVTTFPTPTQYYVAALSTLATSLTSTASKEESSVMSGDILYILAKVLPEVPQAVLRLDNEASITTIASATTRCSNLGCRSGLKCLGTLLASQAKEHWQRPIVARAFKVLLTRLLDSNPKVRKAAQDAVVEILSTPKRQGTTTALDLCLDAIVQSFTSNNDKSILRLLHFSQQVFPFVGTKKTQITFVKHVLELVEQKQASSKEVTEHALNTLLVLIKLLEPGKEEESCLEMTRMLIRQASVLPVIPFGNCLEALNRTHCKDRLVSVKSLLDVFFHKKLEAHEGEQLGRNLFHVCASLESGEDGTELIQSFIAIGLHAHTQSSWSHLLPACALVVKRAQIQQSVLLELTSKAIALRSTLVDWKTGEDKMEASWKVPLQELIVCCADVLGPAQFLSNFPLTQKEDLSLDAAKLCLFPSLQEAWSRPSNDLVLLSTFESVLLPLAKFCEESSVLAEEEGLEINAKLHHTRATQLWSFLPSFCFGASDFARTFPKLERKFLLGLKDGELSPIIAKAITSVISSCLEEEFQPVSGSSHVSKENDDDNDNEEEEEEQEENEQTPNEHHVRPRREKSSQERDADLGSLRSVEEKFLPPLFNVYDSAFREDSAGPRVQAIFACIQAYAAIASPSFRTQLFHQVLKLVLEAIGKEDNETVRVLLGILSALSQSLACEELDVLFKVIRPQLTSETSLDEGVQKRAYTVLIASMRGSPTWVERNSSELIDFLQTSLAKSESKAHLLNCLQELLTSPSITDLEPFCSEMLGEIILCLKESNVRSRTAAFALFTALAQRMEAMNQLQAFFHMTVAGLLTNTPHFRSATMVACTRLISMYGNHEEYASLCVDCVLACLSVFHDEKSREIARSCISLCKTVAIRLRTPELKEKVLHDLLVAILPWSNDTKNRFASLIRIVFDRLIKRVGIREIEAQQVIPEDHRLLAYLKKQSKRKAVSRNSHNKFNSKDGEEEQEEEEDGKVWSNPKRRHHAAVDDVEDPMDLLDAATMLNSSRKGRYNKEEEDMKDDFQRDESGRIIIPKEEDTNKRSRKRNTNEEEVPLEDGNASEEETEPQVTKKKHKKRKVEQTFGKEFKAKKAGGDAKYKGSKTDPYAYIPLDHRMLNKHKKHVAVARFQGVGKSGKKGYRQRR